MSGRPYRRLSKLRHRWERSPFTGGLVGIASVALATLGVGLACSVIALIVSLIY